MGIVRAVVEAQAYLGCIAALLLRIRLRSALQREQFVGRLGEVGVHGFELLDRCKALAAADADQRAFSDQRAADASGDWRPDIGILQIELSGFEPRPRRRLVGLSLGQFGDRAVIELAGGDVALLELGLTFGLLFGEHARRFRPLQGGLGAVHPNAERRGIDAIEHIALTHDGALLEHPLDHDASDPRTHFGDPCRRNTARQIIDDTQSFRRHRYHAHGRGRRRRTICGLFAVTAAREQRSAHRERRERSNILRLAKHLSHH
jgi:hypothetical protein